MLSHRPENFMSSIVLSILMKGEDCRWYITIFLNSHFQMIHLLASKWVNLTSTFRSHFTRFIRSNILLMVLIIHFWVSFDRSTFTQRLKFSQNSYGQERLVSCRVWLIVPNQTHCHRACYEGLHEAIRNGIRSVVQHFGTSSVLSATC